MVKLPGISPRHHNVTISGTLPLTRPSLSQANRRKHLYKMHQLHGGLLKQFAMISNRVY